MNKVSKSDKYPLPRIQSLVEGSGQSQINFLSTLDLKAGFHQVPIAKEDQDKSAFIYPGGFYKWLFMPFGLKSAPSCFQRLMDKVF